jgi:hypothetical protein
MNRRACLAGLSAGFLAQAARADEDWGHFVGILNFDANADGRTFTLRKPYEYDDAALRVWPVENGWVVDGASIPQAFWSIIGGPFEDRYRNASVIHDYYCDVKTRAWQDVHHMFYTAMRANAVNEIKAKIMFAAVWFRGPRWQRVASACSDQADKYVRILQLFADTPGAKTFIDGLTAEFERGCPSDPLKSVSLADVEQMKWLAEQVRATNPPIEQIEQLVRVADIRAKALEEKEPRLRERAVPEGPDTRRPDRPRETTGARGSPG